MSTASKGFGTRKGGLAPTHHVGLAESHQPYVNSDVPAPVQKASAPVDITQSWPEPSPARTPRDISGIKHPITMRYVSGAIDGVILLILTAFLNVILASVIGGANGGDLTVLHGAKFLILLSALGFFYGVIFESSAYQGTPGKIMTGLVVTDMSGERLTLELALKRGCAKFAANFVPFLAGYMLVNFTKRRQALHDLMVGTLVFRRLDLHRPSAAYDFSGLPPEEPGVDALQRDEFQTNPPYSNMPPNSLG